MPSIEKRIVRNVVALDESTSCADAARMMAERKIGSIGVRRTGKLIGIVTERDLIHGVMARGVSGTDVPLSQVMRTDLPFVTPQSTERDAAHLMQSNFTRHLLVKQADEVVGVVSMLDVVQLMLEDNRYLIEQLHTFIRGGRGG
jgi:signal-transduction protein with cAMP-binding, CBS, and nucleotidyltransferase domain